MRCLAVQQPWAWAICFGEKRIENRTWATDYRGTIAIHASTRRSAVKSILKHHPIPGVNVEWFQYGAVIGAADLVDCVELNESMDAELWAEGLFCWIFENARFLDSPIPMKGKLNLFSLPSNVEEQVRRQLARPAPVDDAASLLAQAVRPEPRETLFRQAQSYIEAEKWNDAIRVCTRATEDDPNNAYAYQLRAIALVENGQVKEGLADANQAIALEPDSSGAFYYRAVAKDLLGDEQGMREDYEQARALGAELPPLDELPPEE